jgi:hypothetical protein
MMKLIRSHTIALLLTAPLALGGCAALNEATMRALATPVPALAVVGERVLAGEVLLYTDRSATVQLGSNTTPALSCMGAMRYTSSTGGTVQLSCSDGTQARMNFLALSETSGHGSGRAGVLSASFTYGLDPEPARAWLVAPAGKRLVVSGNGLLVE